MSPLAVVLAVAAAIHGPLGFMAEEVGDLMISCNATCCSEKCSGGKNRRRCEQEPKSRRAEDRGFEAAVPTTSS